MIIISKIVKLKYIMKNIKRYILSKSIKVLQLNAVNIRDCMKYDTTNVQLK